MGAHMSHAYTHEVLSSGISREKAVIASLTALLPSVTMAALTTAIAGGFLASSITLFFYFFGVFMVSMMLLGWAFTVCFFMPLLSLIGPTGKWGSVNPFVLASNKPKATKLASGEEGL